MSDLGSVFGLATSLGLALVGDIAGKLNSLFLQPQSIELPLKLNLVTLLVGETEVTKRLLKLDISFPSLTDSNTQACLYT